MTSEPKGFGIFAKMLAVMLTVALVPTALMGYASYRQQSAELNAGVDARLTATADRLAQYTDQWLDAHLRMLRLVAMHPDMVSMQGEKQKKLLVAINEQYPYIYLAHTIRLDNGMNEGRSDGNPPLYYGDRAYIRDVLSPKGFGLQPAIGKTSNLPAFMLAVPILKDGKTVGVLSAAILIDDISKQIVDAQIGKTGYAFLLDPQGKVVAHPDKDVARVQKDLGRNPAFLGFQKEGKQLFHFKDESGKDVVAVAVGTRDGMTLIAQQDAAEAYLPIKQATEQGATLLLGVLVIVSLLAFAFSRGFTSPIRRLTSVAEAMSLGEVDASISSEARARGDELGGLARAIDRMGVSLKLAMQQLEGPAAQAPANGNSAAAPSSPPPPRHSMAVPKSGSAKISATG